MDAHAADLSPRGNTWPDGFQRAICFYLRDDVSEVLWSLAQRRRLHFYYHTDRDYRRRDAERTRLTLHCPSDVQAFRETIRAVAARVAECGSPFYPFLTMGTRANSPGAPGAVVGYDLCFECDLDLVGSFRALAPVLGVLEYYRVPHLAKFSGQRSLHVLVPAEALAAAVGGESPSEWPRAHERLGRLLCRLVPGISATWVGIAKQQPLSAPYSLHRYNGLVGIPLSLGDVLAFDPASAEPDRFAGVSWRPECWDSAGDGAARLLQLADEAERHPERALDAVDAFAGEQWRQCADADAGSAPSVERSIFAGAVGLAHLPTDLREDLILADRLRQAIVALDDPEAKTMRVQRLFAPDARDIVPLAGRDEACRLLATWALRGLQMSLDSLAIDLLAERGTRPNGVLRAVRLFGLVPESADAKLRSLEIPWRTHDPSANHVGLFLALAIGELAPSNLEAVRLLTAEGASGDEGEFRLVWAHLVCAGGAWRAERDPVRALATIGLAFGAPALRAWVARPDEAGRIVRDGVFGGDERKLAYVGAAVLGRLPQRQDQSRTDRLTESRVMPHSAASAPRDAAGDWPSSAVVPRGGREHAFVTSAPLGLRDREDASLDLDGVCLPGAKPLSKKLDHLVRCE